MKLDDVNKNLAIKDLTLQPDHCLSLIVQELQKHLEMRYGPAKIERGSKIVSLQDNYYSLGYSDNETTLNKRYTRYISENKVLRTQMTAIIPELLQRYSQNPGQQQLWLCPGMVYRRDVVDKTHVGEPHQMDVWYLQKGSQMNRQDLLELVEIIMQVIGKMLGKKIQWRYQETQHHYTDGGIEVEIYHQGKWLEILECGLAGRKLLNSQGLSNYSGLALGMGLDRLAMIIKNLEDIRLLRDPDPRIQGQMGNLNLYKAVSRQPAITRDLSLAVNRELIIEELTEQIIQTMGNQQNLLEEVKLLNSTDYEQLPEVAKVRLGIQPGQSNWLIRIVLRHLGRSINTEEANKIYSLLYDTLHQGTAGYKM